MDELPEDYQNLQNLLIKAYKRVKALESAVCALDDPAYLKNSPLSEDFVELMLTGECKVPDTVAITKSLAALDIDYSVRFTLADVYPKGLKVKLKSPVRGLATVLHTTREGVITLLTDFGNVFTYTLTEMEQEVETAVGFVPNIHDMLNKQLELLEKAKLLTSDFS